MPSAFPTRALPEPRLVLSIEGQRLIFPPAQRVGETPQWAKPIVFADYRHFGLAS